MKIEYTLENIDFLEYHLYSASKSKSIKKKRLKSRIVIPILYSIIGFYFLLNDNKLITFSIFIIFGLLWFLFYPLYSKKTYKKHYVKHVEEHYVNRINTPTEMIINSDFIYAKDHSAEEKIKISEFDKLTELQNHFVLELKRGVSFIIPKKNIVNIGEFKEKILELNIPYNNELNWKWK